MYPCEEIIKGLELDSSVVEGVSHSWDTATHGSSPQETVWDSTAKSKTTLLLSFFSAGIAPEGWHLSTTAPSSKRFGT